MAQNHEKLEALQAASLVAFQGFAEANTPAHQVFFILCPNES